MKISSQLREKTIRRFTNLMDGLVLPNVSVSMILDYIETQQEPVITGNIEQQFINEQITAEEEEQHQEWLANQPGGYYDTMRDAENYFRAER